VHVVVVLRVVLGRHRRGCGIRIGSRVDRIGMGTSGNLARHLVRVRRDQHGKH
jgi:hypothetical protein